MSVLIEHLAVRDGRAVFRVGDASGETMVLKVSAEHDGLADEVSARAMLRAEGFPVAAPLSYLTGPPALLTLPWVDGRPVDGSCPDDSLREVGRLLARAHDMPAAGPFGGHATWSGWMGGWLSHALRWWDAEVPEAVGMLDGMSEVLADLAEPMDDAARSTILFDAPPAHFLCGLDGAVAMIDVERLRAGDPAMDLAVLELWDPEIMSPVVRGYDEKRLHDDPTFERRRSFYVVLRAVAAAEWHSDELADPVRREQFVEIARRRVPHLHVGG